MQSTSNVNLLNGGTSMANGGNGGGLRAIFSFGSLKQLLIFVLNSSIIVKSLCVCVFVGYFLSHNQDVVQYLSVIPGKLLPPNFYLWTLVTHSFIEFNIVELFADWFIILLYSKMLEPLWGSIECIQFYFIITFLAAISTSLVYFVGFALTFKEEYLFNMHIHGLGGLLGGFSVAIKQIMPDTVLINSSFIRLRQDHLPMLVILFSTFLYLVSLTDFPFIIMLNSGVFIGWIYLRFFQKHKNGTRGDSSSTFVYASFFPSQIQPFVAIISNTIFNLLVKVKICKPPQKRYNVAGMGQGGAGSQSHITITLPLMNPGASTLADSTDAERRRQKALKALKERLKKPNEDEDIQSQWGERAESQQSAETNLLLQSSSSNDNINRPGASASAAPESGSNANDNSATI